MGMSIDDVKALHVLVGQYEIAQREYEKVGTIFKIELFYEGYNCTRDHSEEEIDVMKNALRQLRAARVIDLKNELEAKGVDT